MGWTPPSIGQVGTWTRTFTAEDVEAFGRLTFDPESPPTRDDTVSDLASLTKVIATASLVMRAVENTAKTRGRRAGG